MGKCGVQRGSTFPEAVATAENLTPRSGRRVPAACSPRSSRGRRLCVANSARSTPRRIKSAAAVRQRRCRVVSSQPLVVGGRPEQQEETPTQAPGKAGNNTVVCDDGCEDSRQDTASKKHQNEADDDDVAGRPRPRWPPGAEMEVFFAAAEDALRRKFVETYNYDVALDRPSEGRFEWTPVSTYVSKTD